MTCAFRVDRLEWIRELEGEHFWFVARRALVLHLARRHAPALGTVIDVGCGTGSTLRSLARPGTTAIGLDARREGLSPAAGIWFAQADVGRLPLSDAIADTVFALDVLEHVDETAALAEIHRVLQPDGTLIATVPAFMFLWSYRDMDAGHLRRYTARSLRAALTAAGFEVVWLRYFHFLLFPVLALARVLGRSSRRLRDAEDRPLGPLNAVLRGLVGAEVAALRLGLRYPWGSSLAVVARRSGSRRLA